MKKVGIVGAGPAGVSAAIYLLRAGFDVALLYRDRGALGKAAWIENYYGFGTPISGSDLFDQGLAQATRLGAEVIHDEVVGLVWEEKLTLLTQTARYPVDAIILATGAARVAPQIDGIKRLEGAGVSYCAVCDAFFYRNKDVAVLGNGEYALHEARILAETSRQVTLCTQGKPLETTGQLPPNVRVESRKIARLVGDSALEGLAFEDGNVQEVHGLFVAVGIAGSADFARKVGAEIDGARIVVDAHGATTIEGLYAVGDCVGGMLQVAKAVYDGANAAKYVIQYLKKT